MTTKKQVKPQNKKEYKKPVIKKKEIKPKRPEIERPDDKVSVCLSRQQVHNICQAMAKDKELVSLLQTVLDMQADGYSQNAYDYVEVD